MSEKELSFEESLKQLENIVSELESGDIPLDDAILKFDEAMNLVKTCDSKLKSAQESIAKIVDKNNDLIDFNIEKN